MQWFQLSIHWMNGWIVLVVYLAIMGLQPLCYRNRRDIMRRLMIHPRDTNILRWIMPINMFLYHSMLILVVFLPLRLNDLLFIPGLSLFTFSMILYGFSVHAFATTPPDRPVTKGLYRISRNPIHFFSWTAHYCMALVTGSWMILLVNTVLAVGLHMVTLAEERYCLNAYGDAYAEYMKRVPRYLLFQ